MHVGKWKTSNVFTLVRDAYQYEMKNDVSIHIQNSPVVQFTDKVTWQVCKFDIDPHAKMFMCCDYLNAGSNQGWYLEFHCHYDSTL